MKSGFALPSVLVITGATCLALLAAVTAIDGLARSARDTADGATFEARALDLEARTTFAALTAPVSTRAIELRDRRGDPQPLLIDGTAYEAAPGLEVSLQDEAGLINLDTLPAADMPRLFAQFGADPEAAGRLGARLADYIDRDDLVRIGGGEAEAYRAAGLAPPPNQRLRSRADLLGVLGWNDATPAGAWRAARGPVVTNDDVGMNINAMPAPVLQVLYGLDAQAARAAVARRRLRPFASLEELGRAGGQRLVGDAERRVVDPSGRFLFTVTAVRPGRVWTSRIVLAPVGDVRPFVVQDRGGALLIKGKEAQAGRDAAPPPFPAH